MFTKTSGIKKYFIILLFLTIQTFVFAQSLKIPMLTAEKKVNSLAWSLDSNYFAYTDGSNIIIRDAAEYFTRYTIKTNYKNILEIRFVDPVFDNSEEDRTFILLVTDTNIVEIRQLFYFEDDIGNKNYYDDTIFTLTGNQNVKACSFTSTQDIRFIALGYEDGSFSLYNYNSLSQEYIEESYEIGETPINSIDISSKQNMLLTCTDNGIIYIWNNSMEPLSSFSYYEESMQKVFFNDDSNYPIISAQDDYSLTKYNLEAKQKAGYSLNSEELIKDYIISYDRKTALVLDQKNILNVYNLDSSDFIGFIPNFSDSPITLFQIDYTQTKFLIAHEDNSIFILEINKVLFPKNASLPQADLVHMDSENALQKLYEEEPVPEAAPEEPQEDSSREEAVTQTEGSEEESEKNPEDEKQLYEALAMIRYKNTDTIGFRLKGSVTPGPFILGTGFAAGYTVYRLIQPFYFGGFMEVHFNFPQKDFPYKYQMGGAAISSPIITGGKLYLPFGICVYPFQQNIELFVDFAPGITMNLLWNAKFADQAISSKIYTGFYGALRTGVTFKNISVFMEGNYDAILGFGFSIGIGYNINISFERRAGEVWSLEEEEEE